MTINKDELEYIQRNLKKDARESDKKALQMFTSHRIKLAQLYEAILQNNGMDKTKVSFETFTSWVQSLGYLSR